MDLPDRAMHYVCTMDEARQLVEAETEYWVSNCGCREARGRCARSRHDVCLMFVDVDASGSGKRRIDRGEVERILGDAGVRRLVARPFRNAERTLVEGICFCCDDCCEYFLNPGEKCDKGALIERTDAEACTDCALCVDSCYFDARRVFEGALDVLRERCHGCGLCIDVCPEACVTMVQRES